MPALLQPFMGAVCQPLDNDGAPVAGGFLHFYEAGLGPGVEQDTYANAAGSVINDNPVELDGNGRAVVFLMADAAYDITFKDADGVTIWTRASIIAPVSPS